MNRPEVANKPACEILLVATWHSLAWLVAANLVGLLLATLLLIPGLNNHLGEWTYGRWIPVHLNMQLYGWCSLPLVGWLLKIYQADRIPASCWSRAALWAWSAALFAGAVSWLQSHSSGKIFLEWQGYVRVLFPLAMFVLWLVLAGSLRSHWRSPENAGWRRMGKALGLIVLLAAPFALYWAAGTKVYPPVNPDTGGPTGVSLAESTLFVVIIFLLIPHGLGRRPKFVQLFKRLTWMWFALSVGLLLALGHGNDSHHRLGQIIALGSLLPWMFLLPAYYNSFEWPDASTSWRRACFFWWGVLLASAWLVFLPGLLDHFKFTDALVGHSHMAMAGFISSLNCFLLVLVEEANQEVFDSLWAFIAWQAGTFGYVGLMFVAGWIEGGDPSFTIIPGFGREAIYIARLACGVLMAAASIHWLRQVSVKLHRQADVSQRQACAPKLCTSAT